MNPNLEPNGDEKSRGEHEEWLPAKPDNYLKELKNPHKCTCGGTFEYYDGWLGYESFKCNLCGADIADESATVKKDDVPTPKDRDAAIESISTDLTNRLTYELPRIDISESALKSLRVLQNRISTILFTHQIEKIRL